MEEFEESHPLIAVGDQEAGQGHGSQYKHQYTAQYGEKREIIWTYLTNEQLSNDVSANYEPMDKGMYDRSKKVADAVLRNFARELGVTLEDILRESDVKLIRPIMRKFFTKIVTISRSKNSALTLEQLEKHFLLGLAESFYNISAHQLLEKPADFNETMLGLMTLEEYKHVSESIRIIRENVTPSSASTTWQQSQSRAAELNDIEAFFDTLFTRLFYVKGITDVILDFKLPKLTPNYVCIIIVVCCVDA